MLRKEMSYVPDAAEKRLVAGCQKGDRRCQQQLFDRSYSMLLGVCLRYATHRDQAQDILQEAYIKIFSKMSQFRFENTIDAWMRRIAVHSAIDYYREASAGLKTTALEDSSEYFSNTDIIGDISHAELLQSLNSLPAGYRIIFNLQVIEGYSHSEIGKMLDISESTSKSQLRKAKEVLRKLLSHSYNEQ